MLQKRNMFYNLGIYFTISYITDTLPIPRLWCEISTSEYPCPHYDIFEDLKPAKIINLENDRENVEIWVLTFTFFLYRPLSHTLTHNTEYIIFNHITVFVITQAMYLNNKWNSNTHVLYIMPENVTRKVPATIPITKKWNPT